MKKQYWILLALFVITNLSTAQVSPEILKDGRVTFRIVAPNAGKVIVKGQFGDTVELTKTNKKLWEGTTPSPVIAGIHEYSFYVDGKRCIDSRNRHVKPQRWPHTSILHINSDPLAHWDLQNIPHGAIHFHDYYSQELQQWRKLAVYTPPGYKMQKLPVLFLSHGYSDNEETWTSVGKTHWIADSLIQSGKSNPMIIVMPDAHPLDPEGNEYRNYAPANTFAYARELVNDMIPFIEKNYNVSSEAKDRAFAGLSMGGGHAFVVAMTQHDKFSYIGAFSSSVPPAGYIKDNASVQNMNRDLSLFWIACGDQDFLYETNQKTHKLLDDIGIEHEYLVTKDDTHSWPVWRNYLSDFLPLLFK